MLTPDEAQEIERDAEMFPRRRAACIEALKIVQRRKGWVDDEALADVAQALGMTPAEVEGVATFYSLIFREPVGRHVIFVCDSVSCWVVGYEALYDAFRERLGIGFGETTSDNRFTLLPIPCLGACDRAPAILIDNDLHLNVSPNRVDELLNRYA